MGDGAEWTPDARAAWLIHELTGSGYDLSPEAVTLILGAVRAAADDAARAERRKWAATAGDIHARMSQVCLDYARMVLAVAKAEGGA